VPIYEYTCPSCRKIFEEWVKEHDTTPQPCPDCGAMSPHIVSHTTFVLKGGGWYVTEYGNRKNAHAPSASAAAEKASSDAPADAAAPSSGAGDTSTAQPATADPGAKSAAASAA